jgi:MFS family permease
MESTRHRSPSRKDDTIRELLRERDFRRLLGAQFVSQAADGLAQGVAGAVLVLDPLESGTPERIFVLFAQTLLPYSLISPFLGVFVDRWDRKKLLIGTLLLRSALLVTLPAWSQATSQDQALMLSVLGLLGLGRLFSTTKGAVIPVVLHEHHLLRGNTLSSIIGFIAALAGGVIGLGISGTMDPALALALVGLCYIPGALAAGRIGEFLGHPPRATVPLTSDIGRVARELRQGVREVWNRPMARWPLVSIFLLRVSGIIVAIAAIVIIKAEFPGDSGELGRKVSGGVLLGLSGVGGFLASFSAPLLGRHLSKPALILFGFVVSGVAIIAFGGFTSVIPVGAVMLLGGFGGFITKVSVDAQVQEALPDDYRGRAFALYDILYNVASVTAAAVVVAMDDLPVTAWMIGTGVATLACAAALAAVMSRSGMLVPSVHAVD